MSRREENRTRLIEATQRVLSSGGERLIPETWGKWRRSGDEIRDQPNNRSFNVRTGLWQDLRNAERAGDLLSFVAMEVLGLPDCRGSNFITALERLCAEAGMSSAWQPSAEDARRHAEAGHRREVENQRAAKTRRRAFSAFCQRVHERRRAIS